MKKNPFTGLFFVLGILLFASYLSYMDEGAERIIVTSGASYFDLSKEFTPDSLLMPYDDNGASIGRKAIVPRHYNLIRNKLFFNRLKEVYLRFLSNSASFSDSIGHIFNDAEIEYLTRKYEKEEYLFNYIVCSCIERFGKIEFTGNAMLNRTKLISMGDILRKARQDGYTAWAFDLNAEQLKFISSMSVIDSLVTDIYTTDPSTDPLEVFSIIIEIAKANNLQNILNISVIEKRSASSVAYIVKACATELRKQLQINGYRF